MPENYELPISRKPMAIENLPQAESLKIKKDTTPREMFPGLGKDYAAFGFNNGCFSFGDVIEYCLQTTGPAHALISSWVASWAATTKVCDFLDTGRFLSCRFLLDRMFSTTRKKVYDFIVNKYGTESIRTSRIHTKFCVLYNDQWFVVIETSANLNKNLRLETFRITENERFARFFINLFEDLFAVIDGKDNETLASAQKLELITEQDLGGKQTDAERNAIDLGLDFESQDVGNLFEI